MTSNNPFSHEDELKRFDGIHEAMAAALEEGGQPNRELRQAWNEYWRLREYLDAMEANENQ